MSKKNNISRKYLEKIIPESDRKLFGILEKKYREIEEINESESPQEKLYNLLDEKFEEVKEEIIEQIEGLREQEKSKLISFFEELEYEDHNWQNLFILELLEELNKR